MVRSLQATAPATSSARRRPAAARVAEPLPAHDVLVFEQSDHGFHLLGGKGRGEGWAGIVHLDGADEALVGRAWQRGTAERSSGLKPTQVAGPYYAKHAVAVPTGQSHVVVFGGDYPISWGETELLRRAADAVDGADGVPAHKLLADELELVHALRALMAYRPITVRDTIRHIATIAGEALSCEVAVMRVELDGQTLVEGLDLRSMSELADPDAGRSLASIDARVGPTLEQVASPERDLFGVEVASQLMLPLPGTVSGALALGHAVGRPRGFTSLCQRIGRAIADAAELLISQAHAREQLDAERELQTRMARTDALTGGENRRAWDDAVSQWTAGCASGQHEPAVVMSCDLDGLKVVNDRFGHGAGDQLIRGASNMLRACVRESDLAARVGGDEFLVLLRPADAAVARRIVARVRRAERAWRVTEHGLTPRMSIGLAAVVDGDLERARMEADRAMYANKRRRAASPSQVADVPKRDRRARATVQR